MAQRCELCGKSPQHGLQISFSKHATHRRFMPNLAKRKLVVHGKRQRLMVCTGCLRTLNKTHKGRFARSLERAET